MTSRSLILPAALAIAGAAGLAVWLLRSSPADKSAATTAGETARAKGSPPRPWPHETPPAPQDAPKTPAAVAAEGGKSLHVRRDQTVVTVNGVPIKGSALMAFHSGDGDDHTMSTEMYEHLKKRAIERELTFQDAKKKGVQLSPA